MTFASNLRCDLASEAQSRDPLAFDPDTPVREVVAALQQHNAGTAVVSEEGRPVGIFTERDAIRLIAAASDMAMPIRDVMINPVVCLPRQASVGQAIQLMQQHGYRSLPIVDDDGKLQGMIKVSGIVHYFVDHFPQTVLNLAAPNGTSEREGA
ncbi:MAG: CBS domain-containing protein [Pirellulales bacterium]